MSDTRVSVTDATDERVQIAVDRNRFDQAFADRGATDPQSRADLLGRTRRQVWAYTQGFTPPSLLNARDIADRLGVHPDDLWPYTPKAAA